MKRAEELLKDCYPSLIVSDSHPAQANAGDT